MTFRAAMGSAGLLALALLGSGFQDSVDEVRSAQSGSWSTPTTWENGRLPAAGNKESRPHTVLLK